MVRVTRGGGVVAASVWDLAGGRAPLSVYWEAAHSVDAGTIDESGLAGTREGHLAGLFSAAGLREREETTQTVRSEYATFDEWWEPYTLGVGPAGAYVKSRDDEQRERLRALCEELLPPAPFTLRAWAWAARGVA